MKLADQIKFDLMYWVRGSQTDIIIPNFYLGTWYEMDLFRLTKAGVVYEYEIKISRGDFKNDFKKGITEYNCKSKHDSIKTGERLCNYFYFVCPEGLIKKEEIPDHCGLIYFNHRLSIVKTAKKLHNNRFGDYKMLADKLAYRLSIKESMLRTAKMQLKELKLLTTKQIELKLLK
jgi:hypothetical protein